MTLLLLSFSLQAIISLSYVVVLTTSFHIRSQQLDKKITKMTSTVSSGTMLSSSSTSSATNAGTVTSSRNKFQFIEYGCKYVKNEEDDERIVISCDGLVPSSSNNENILHLSHWTDNTTPDEYYADTSTEMAIKYSNELNSKKHSNNNSPPLLVLNNHYDTDGVLSVFTCIQPDIALKYSNLFISAAEAGDFGEWNNDNGIKLDISLCSLLEEHNNNNNNEEKAYQKALKILPDLVNDIICNSKKYDHLWQSGYEYAQKCYAILKKGQEVSVRMGPSGIIILKEPFYLSSYAVHKYLLEQYDNDEYYSKIKRLLRYNTSTRQIIYEKPGHGWVKKLIQRIPIPDTDATLLEQQMNNDKSNNSYTWKVGGPGGLISIIIANNDDNDKIDNDNDNKILLDHIATKLSIYDKGLCK